MTEMGKLRWQCRRSSRELDLLLDHYLQTCYTVADEEEKAHFIEMLQLDDAELLQQLKLSVGLKSFAD
jgi:antitoxin CptB